MAGPFPCIVHCASPTQQAWVRLRLWHGFLSTPVRLVDIPLLFWNTRPLTSNHDFRDVRLFDGPKRLAVRATNEPAGSRGLPEQQTYPENTQSRTGIQGRHLLSPRMPARSARRRCG